MHKIGYYVNNHGTGHTNRLFCFIKELEAMSYDYKLYVFAENLERITSLELPDARTTTGGPRIILIPLPRPEWKLNISSKIFHCLPKNYKDYFGVITQTCIEECIETFVSDLSVEVGIAVRLHVDKLIYILLHGSRIDNPHRNLFYEADKLLVPFSECLEDSYFKDFKRNHNLKYSGGFLKFQYQNILEEYPEDYNLYKKNVLIILGTGGDSFDESYIDLDESIYNVVILGKKRFVNPFNYIRCADYVVANAGDSIMHEIAYFNKPYICIPEERPFEEQEIKAYTLEREQMACISNWESLLSHDLENLRSYPLQSKEPLIQNDKARVYANEIINC